MADQRRSTTVNRLREMSPLYEMAKEGDRPHEDRSGRRTERSALQLRRSTSDRNRDYQRRQQWHTATRSSTTTRTRATSARCRQDDAERRHRPRRRARVRRRDEAADQGQPGDRRHRGREVQDVRLRLGDRRLAASPPSGSRARRSTRRWRSRTPTSSKSWPAAGEDPLLGAGRGRDQGGDRRLQEEAGSREAGSSRPAQSNQASVAAQEVREFAACAALQAWRTGLKPLSTASQLKQHHGARQGHSGHRQGRCEDPRGHRQGRHLA